MDILLYLFISVNLASLILMGVDKWKAKSAQWRVPEWVLLAVGLFGAFGAVCGALLFHHKISKPLFRFMLPLELLLNVVAMLAYLR